MIQNDIHSCHPWCDRPMCVAARESAAAERENIAKLFDDPLWREDYKEIAKFIRAQGVE